MTGMERNNDEDNMLNQSVSTGGVIQRFVCPAAREVQKRELPELLPMGEDMLLIDERLKLVRFKVFHPTPMPCQHLIYASP